jgi:D-serine deaminase-like pyridoxal phosphate-dependent protein
MHRVGVGEEDAEALATELADLDGLAFRGVCIHEGVVYGEPDPARRRTLARDLGVVPADRCALSVLATVVSHAAPDRAVVDAGAKALTLDRGAHGLELLPGYGQARGRGDITIAGLSEEHGWLRLERSTAGDLAVGTRLEITPNHACTVVNCFDTATVIRDGAVVAQWAVAARGRMT